jgi:hypothetical protein
MIYSETIPGHTSDGNVGLTGTLGVTQNRKTLVLGLHSYLARCSVLVELDKDKGKAGPAFVVE